MHRVGSDRTVRDLPRDLVLVMHTRITRAYGRVCLMDRDLRQG